MLSRTAANLYWIGRNIERAEANARLLEVGARNALIPDTGGGFRNEWDAVLRASGTAADFAERYGETVQRNIETHLFFDLRNPSSVAACIERARENGRIVRTALTRQMWYALNIAHQEMREMARTERSKLSISDMVDWTVRVVALLRGSVEDTMLRKDGYDFLNIGTALERADSTARILDVKYFVLLPHIGFVGSGLDNYQWRTILRALSLERAVTWAYGGEITPQKIADFLILNRASPRSILTSVETLSHHLDRLARGYGRSSPAQEAARRLHAELAEARIEHVLDEGLHEFLSRMIDALAGLAGTVQSTYFSGEMR